MSVSEEEVEAAAKEIEIESLRFGFIQDTVARHYARAALTAAAQVRERAGKGGKIVQGLREAVAGNLAVVTIEGQVWERRPGNARHTPDLTATPAWDAPANRYYAPVEERAAEIYAAFKYEGPGKKPAWVPHGNATMQDHARALARRQLLPIYGATEPDEGEDVLGLRKGEE